jgi:protein-S-isoprenylcysteine O-methyltransferase
VGIVWAATAIRARKRIVERERAESRNSHLLASAIAFSLLFSPTLRFGPLAWRALPESDAMGAMGVALTAAGAGFAIWARFLLGGNWSAAVAIKEGHSLVRRGPYALARHPIYGGLLTAMLGTAVAGGEAGALCGVAIAFATWLEKARREEQFLLARFGADYADYRRRVRTLIPFVL